jgi:transcriptional activator of cad operon
MPNLTANKFKVGDWTVDPQLDVISNAGKVIKLEPRMMRLLVCLAESSGQVLSSAQLLDRVWSGVVVGPASVYQAISALRKLLEDTDPTPTYIATVTRKGYRLVAPVTVDESASPAPVPAPALGSRPIGRWIAALAAAALIAMGAWYFWPQSGAPPGPAQVASAPLAIAALPRLVVPDFVPASGDEEPRIFAISVSELLRSRLLPQPDLVLIRNFRSFGLLMPGENFLEASRRTSTQFVLKGSAARTGDDVKIDVELVKVDGGKSLWTLSFQRPGSDMAVIREQIVSRIAQSLQLRLRDTGNRPVDLDQQVLFMRAQLMRFTGRSPDSLQQAQAMFSRATVLYPRCAPCYLGLAGSLEGQRLPADSYQQRVDEAVKALDRAIELDPDSAEALYARAAHIEDATKADQMFRRSLELAPNDEYAYVAYGRYLETVKRTGEAIDIYNRGLQLDPVSEFPLLNMARVMIFTRGDVAEFERLLRELISNCSGCSAATLWLARSRLVLSGASAEAVKTLEQDAAGNPDDFEGKPLLTAAYLEVDDLDAASAVAADNALAQLQVGQYRHQHLQPSKLPDGLRLISFPGGPGVGFNPLAEAVRDEVMETHQYASALGALDIIFRGYTFPPPGACKVQLLSAHVLMLSGDTRKAETEARDLLTMLDNEAVGRPPHWFARERASAYMLLGDREHAIAELQESQKRDNFVRWWYTGEFDPLFAPLHGDPRFQLLVAAARKHRVEQRALLEEMRRKGEVPTRTPTSAAHDHNL